MPSKFLPSSALSPTPKGPQNAHEWNLLLSKAINRATEKGDRRVTGLRQAMQDGRAEKILRQMSILTETDIDREFGPAET